MQIVFVSFLFFFKFSLTNNPKENENAEWCYLPPDMQTFQYSPILAVSQFYPPFLLASSPTFLGRLESIRLAIDRQQSAFYDGYDKGKSYSSLLFFRFWRMEHVEDSSESYQG